MQASDKGHEIGGVVALGKVTVALRELKELQGPFPWLDTFKDRIFVLFLILLLLLPLFLIDLLLILLLRLLLTCFLLEEQITQYANQAVEHKENLEKSLGNDDEKMAKTVLDFLHKLQSFMNKVAPMHELAKAASGT